MKGPPLLHTPHLCFIYVFDTRPCLFLHIFQQPCLETSVLDLQFSLLSHPFPALPDLNTGCNHYLRKRSSCVTHVQLCRQAFVASPCRLLPAVAGRQPAPWRKFTKAFPTTCRHQQRSGSSWPSPPSSLSSCSCLRQPGRRRCESLSSGVCPPSACASGARLSAMCHSASRVKWSDCLCLCIDSYSKRQTAVSRQHRA